MEQKVISSNDLILSGNYDEQFSHCYVNQAEDDLAQIYFWDMNGERHSVFVEREEAYRFAQAILVMTGQFKVVG